MSIESDIVTRAAAHVGLNALIAGRCYEEKAPQKATYPLVIFRHISGPYPQHAMGNTPRFRWRYQFDAYAVKRSDAIALRDQVIDAFNQWRPLGVTVHCSFLEDGGFTEKEGLGTSAQVHRGSVDMCIYS